MKNRKQYFNIKNTHTLDFLFDNNIVHIVYDNSSRIWFYASEVSKILGYSSAHDMIRKLPKEEVRKVKVNNDIRTTLSISKNRGGPQYLSLVSFEGLYRIILRATIPYVIKFQNWILYYVLPTIHDNIQGLKHITHIVSTYSSDSV